MCTGVSRRLCQIRRQLHTVSSSHEGPSETLKRKIAGLQRTRKSKKNLKIKKDQFIVEVPESKSYLDTASLPMILTVVGVGLFAKLLMMYDDSKSQELIERKIKNAPDGQGMVRMLSREEWEEIREVRPRTPFESKLARPNAQIRTGERLRKLGKPATASNRGLKYSTPRSKDQQPELQQLNPSPSPKSKTNKSTITTTQEKHNSKHPEHNTQGKHSTQPLRPTLIIYSIDCIMLFRLGASSFNFQQSQCHTRKPLT
ncbi:uncharacterized protein LOC112040161 isoform X1 [Quercus suber]|uniref:uncharacterized protein LOC112040161 isoform X1 n=1 Tax=Quercus suber TaxID=58331 RepID=UPI0032E0117A